jgi:hypothetical protein
LAAKLDLAIDGGTDWTRDLLWKDQAGNPVDLSGFTAKMQVRPQQASSTVIVELTTEDGGIELQPGSAQGVIRLVLTNAQTASLPKKAVYDLDMVDSGGKVRRLVQGKVLVSLAVTR